MRTLRLLPLLLLMLILAESCKTKYVSVPEIHNVYTSKTDTMWQHDSCYVLDSVWSVIQGDTVTRYKWRTQYKDHYIYKVKTDTVLKSDTITKIQTVSQATKSKISSIDILVIGVIAGMILISLIAWFTRK